MKSVIKNFPDFRLTSGKKVTKFWVFLDRLQGFMVFVFLMLLPL